MKKLTKRYYQINQQRNPESSSGR